MEQIKHGNVTMRSRASFTFALIASITAVILAGFATAYLFSIATFWVRIQTATTMAWGARANLNEALVSFPWWIIPVALALLAAAIWLIRRQGRMYRYKTSLIALALVVLSLAAGVGMSFVGVGESHAPGAQTQHGQGWRPANR